MAMESITITTMDLSTTVPGKMTKNMVMESQLVRKKDMKGVGSTETNKERGSMSIIWTLRSTLVSLKETCRMGKEESYLVMGVCLKDSFQMDCRMVKANCNMSIRISIRESSTKGKDKAKGSIVLAKGLCSKGYGRTIRKFRANSHCLMGISSLALLRTMKDMMVSTLTRMETCTAVYGKMTLNTEKEN